MLSKVSSKFLVYVSSSLFMTYGNRIRVEIRRRIRCRNTVPEITDKYGLFTALKVLFCEHVRKRTVNESVLSDLGYPDKTLCNSFLFNEI